MRRLVIMSLVALLAVAAAACGLPADGDFSRISPSEDGFGLSATTTTSTTTTVPSTTVAPSTTMSATTTTSIALETTTTIPVELVTVYYPSGRQLAPAQRPLAPNPGLNQVMALILSGPPEGELYVGMRSILPPKSLVTADRVAGVAVVDFPPGVFDDISPVDQRLVFGQIVLTLTGLRGVGQVRFTQAGEDMSVYLGNASHTTPGQVVSEEDYTMLVNGSGPPLDTTTTSTTIDPTLSNTTVVPEG